MMISAWFRAASASARKAARAVTMESKISLPIWGTQEFPRVRIGVGEKPARMDPADYVLGHFPKEEAETMTTAFKDGAAAVVDMMTEGVEAAMNHFNGAARGEKEKLEKQKAERKEEVKTQ